MYRLCKKAQEEAESSANKIDYKKLTIRICLVVLILVVSITYTLLSNNSDEQDIVQESSQTESIEYEKEDSTSYENDDIANEIFGSWINTNNNGVWTFKENEYIMDYSNAFPGDYSDDAVKVRQMDPIHVPCQIDDNYLIYNMSGVSYCNRFDISGNTLTIVNSVSGQSTTYIRK